MNTIPGTGGLLNLGSVNFIHVAEVGSWFRLGLYILLVWFGLKVILELMKFSLS
jgi:hypothetical protein